MVFKRKTGAKREKGVLSQRQLRVGEEIKHILSNYIRRGDFYDPALAGLDVTVTEVRVSPDLSYATVYVYPLGGKDVEATVKLMNDCKKTFRYHVGQNLDIYVTPDLVFRADNSFEQAQRIEDLLRRPEVQRDLLKKDGESGAD